MGRPSHSHIQTQASTYSARARTSLAQNGKSFFWASKLLGREMADNAAGLYMFCRLVDDLADGDLPEGTHRLGQIHACLTALRDDRPQPFTDPDLSAFLSAVTCSDLLVEPLIHLLDGLLFDQGNVAIEDEEALIIYAYQVAGTVGRMMCPILGCHDNRARAFAIDMGIAMQLTNIARDVYEDACLGRRYLPASWVGPLSADDIKSAAQNPDSPAGWAVQTGLKRLLNLADIYYRSAEPGLSFLPMRAHLAIGVAGRVYERIGLKLAAGNFSWHSGRVITGSAEKLSATLGALPLLRYRARPVPEHNNYLHLPLAAYLSPRGL